MVSPTAKIANQPLRAILPSLKFFSPRRLISLLYKEIWENRERKGGREMRKFSCPSGEGEIKKREGKVFNYYSIFLALLFLLVRFLIIIHLVLSFN